MVDVFLCLPFSGELVFNSVPYLDVENRRMCTEDVQRTAPVKWKRSGTGESATKLATAAALGRGSRFVVRRRLAPRGRRFG